MIGTIVQFLLLAATLVLAFYFLTNRRKARAKAGVKLGFVVFIVAAVWAVLRPDDLTVLANWIGVDRGTDLLRSPWRRSTVSHGRRTGSRAPSSHPPRSPGPTPGPTVGPPTGATASCRRSDHPTMRSARSHGRCPRR